MPKKVFKTNKDTLMSLIDKCKNGITEKELKSTPVSNIGKNLEEVSVNSEKCKEYIKEFASIKACTAILSRSNEKHNQLLADKKTSNLCTTLSSIISFSEEIVSKEVEQRKTGKVEE
jgi:hypothetical protein